MKIYIPSRGRGTRAELVTAAYTPFRWLTKDLLRNTILVVRDEEVEAYERAVYGIDVSIMACGSPKNLSEKRDLIARHVYNKGEKKFLMSDDDVMLYIRKSPTDWHLRYPTKREPEDLIKGMEDLLDQYPMVGLSMREGNNRVGEGPWPLIKECQRSCRFYAFRTADYLSIEPNRLPEMADFDTTLQFLTRGQKNAVIYYWANGQPGSQHKGGCSIYRTSETHDAVCRQLQQLYPSFVSLRQKNNKGHQSGFGTRTEVTVQWKKAYESCK